MAPMKRLFGAFALAAIAAAACAPADAKNAHAAHARGVAGLIPLDITTAKGVLHYRVEVATTNEEQARGLMYRTSLAPHGGMIFPMVPERVASFWMKDTYIPLDIVFIRRNGTIESIAADAKPEDLTPLESGEPVAAVLEIAGGAAAKLGIVPGDKVRW